MLTDMETKAEEHDSEIITYDHPMFDNWPEADDVESTDTTFVSAPTDASFRFPSIPRFEATSDTIKGFLRHLKDDTNNKNSHASEKMDGSKFTFTIVWKDGKWELECWCGTTRIQLPNNCFDKAVEALQGLVHQLNVHYVYHSEALTRLKQSKLIYKRMPPRYVMLFDIQDKRTGRWLSWQEVAAEAKRLGLESVPIVVDGANYDNATDLLRALRSVLDKMETGAYSSVLGGRAEGLVIKHPCFRRSGKEPTALKLKMVTAAFKEFNRTRSKPARSVGDKFMSPSDTVAWIGSMFDNGARVHKALQHLATRDNIHTPTNTQVAEELDRDFIKENVPLVQMYLWNELSTLIEDRAHIHAEEYFNYPRHYVQPKRPPKSITTPEQVVEWLGSVHDSKNRMDKVWFGHVDPDGVGFVDFLPFRRALRRDFMTTNRREVIADILWESLRPELLQASRAHMEEFLHMEKLSDRTVSRTQPSETFHDACLPACLPSIVSNLPPPETNTSQPMVADMRDDQHEKTTFTRHELMVASGLMPSNDNCKTIESNPSTHTHDPFESKKPTFNWIDDDTVAKGRSDAWEAQWKQDVATRQTLYENFRAGRVSSNTDKMDPNLSHEEDEQGVEQEYTKEWKEKLAPLAYHTSSRTPTGAAQQPQEEEQE